MSSEDVIKHPHVHTVSDFNSHATIALPASSCQALEFRLRHLIALALPRGMELFPLYIRAQCHGQCCSIVQQYSRNEFEQPYASHYLLRCYSPRTTTSREGNPLRVRV